MGHCWRCRLWGVRLGEAFHPGPALAPLRPWCQFAGPTVVESPPHSSVFDALALDLTIEDSESELDGDEPEVAQLPAIAQFRHRVPSPQTVAVRELDGVQYSGRSGVLGDGREVDPTRDGGI